MHAFIFDTGATEFDAEQIYTQHSLESLITVMCNSHRVFNQLITEGARHRTCRSVQAAPNCLGPSLATICVEHCVWPIRVPMNVV